MAYLFEKPGALKAVTEEELQACGDGGSYIIALDHGLSTDGKAYWLYIKMPPHKYGEFVRLAASRAAVSFDDFGEIIRYGYQGQVPDSVKSEMKEKHNIDEKYMQWLEQDYEKARQAYLKEKEAHDNKRIGDIVAMLKKQQ